MIEHMIEWAPVPFLLSGEWSDFLGFVMSGLFIAAYIFRAISMHTIAKRRGTGCAWFAWVPVLNYFMLGKLADQYSSLVKGRKGSQRWWLLVLGAVYSVFTFAAVVMLGLLIAAMLLGVISLGSVYLSEKYTALMDKALVHAGLYMLVSVLVGIPLLIVRFVALFRVYESCRPQAKELLIIVNVLLPVAEPVLLFLCRKDDLGFTRPAQTFTTGPEVPPHGRPGNPGDYAEPWQ